MTRAFRWKGLVSDVVTTRGGSASVVVSNTSRGMDIRSGAARFFNSLASAVG